MSFLLKNNFLFFLLVSAILPVFAHAQEQAAPGIRWVENLSWQQIKEKAKAENKLIFIDCYATWCGPCKMMDAQVYPDSAVGALMNDQFISVKVQMDKTIKDNEL